MTQVFIDANLALQLRSSTGPVIVCDPNGNVIGLFTPTKRKIPLTEEEIQQAKQKQGGRPLADILADLEKA